MKEIFTTLKRDWKKICAHILIVSLVIGLCPSGLTTEKVNISNEETSKEQEGAKNSLATNIGESQIENATILCELKNERTANQKQFLMSDRTKKIVVYSEPVHYKDNGKWKDIDNSLEQEEAKDEGDFSGYVNKDNGFEVKIADNSTVENLVKIQKDKYKLQFKYNSNSNSNNKQSSKEENKLDNKSQKENIKEDYNEVNKDIDNKKSNKITKKVTKKSKKQNAFKGKNKKLKVNTTSETITYNDVEEDVDIDYVVTSTGLKENIIVNEKQDSYNYAFDIEVFNLTLALKDNEIIAKDTKTGKAVYKIPVPYMYDAAGDISNDVKYTLKFDKKTKDYTLAIKADKKWINSADRTFPVTIDPAITTETTKAAIASTFVASNTATTNYNEYKMLLVGRESAAYGKCRTFVKFALPQLNVGDIVVSAKLNLLQYFVDSYTDSMPDLPVEAYTVTSTWSESSLTWNTMPSVDNKALDFSYMSKDDDTVNKLYDITKAVKSWYDGDVTNYGIMLKSGKENDTLVNSGIYCRYWSEKYNEETDAYPVIELEYRNSKGIEDYYSYTDIDGGEAGTAYINDYTGNLVVTNEGVSTSGEKAPASVYLVYNSADKDKYNYGSKPYVGKGWKLNIQQTVKSSSEYGLTGTALTTYPYVYTDEDGTEHYFMSVEEDGTIKYYDEDGLGLELTKDSSGKYTIKDSQDGKMTFLSNGNLSTIADANGNTITINYDSTNTVIQSVTDGAGRSIGITTSSNYLNKLTDPAGRHTTYTIADSKLTTITNPDSTAMSYTYASDNVLTSVKDIDNYKVNFTYLSAAKGRRVSRIDEYGYDTSTGYVLGQSIGFSYAEYNQTDITTSGIDNSYGTSDDVVTEYQFDNYGRLVSTNSKADGKRYGASTATYTAGEANASKSNIKQLNRVTKSATLGGNVNNIALNHSMERSETWYYIKNGTCTPTKGYTTEESYIGSKSIKLGVTGATSGSRLRYREMFTNSELVPGKTYTFSAYIKTKNLSPITAGKYGAGLIAYSYFADGTSKAFYSDYISTSTDTSINNGWRRESVTFTVPTNATETSINLLIRESNGTAYFDAVQVEEGDVANKYNLLENSSFENTNGTYNYTSDNMTSSDGVISTSIDGSKGYKIIGDKDNYKWLIQEIPVSGSEDDTYIVSGWAKANAAPAFISDDSSSVNRRFKISTKITYSDGTTKWKTAAEFNHDVAGWQYSAVVITLSDENDSTTKTPVKLGIYPRYEYQVNSCVFDALSVVREDVPTYTYDSEGNMISIVDNANQQSTMAYTNNNLMSETDAKGYAYTYNYDDKHNMTKATSQRGITYNYTYNSAGNPTSLVIQNMPTSSYDLRLRTDMEYSSDGAYVTKVTDQEGNDVTNTYNTDKGLLTSTTNQLGQTTSYTYDNNNDIITKVATTNDDGDEVNNTFGYSNHVLNRITHNGFNYNYEYDKFGNETSVKVGSTPLVITEYGNNNSDITKVTYGNGDYNTFTYDKYGNVATIGVNGTTTFKNYSDTSGNVVRNEDTANKLLYNYDYDSTSRLIRSSVMDTSLSASAQRNIYATEYGYDLNNNVNKVVNKAGTKTLTTLYTYSKDNHNTQVTLPSSKTISYTYDSLARLGNYQFNTTTPFKVAYGYYTSENRNSDGGEVYRSTRVSTETIGSDVYKYTYDKLGNITRIQHKLSGGSYSDVVSYVYDSLGQLVRENNALEYKTRVYNYDNGGNITSEEEHTYNTGELGTPAYVIEYGYTDTNWKDKLTSYDGEEITYDEIGNPTTYRGYTLDWSNGRELTSLTGRGHNITYTYDASGLRLSKTVGGETTKYEYVDGLLMYEKKGDTEVHYAYDGEGNPRYIQTVASDGTVEEGYLVTNTRGDVVAIVDNAGNVVAKYTYDAWGKLMSVTDASGNDIENVSGLGYYNSLRYRGYCYDGETCLYYLQSRYYDPQVKRFINADDRRILEKEQGNIIEHNLFTYCLNNPVNKFDSNGEIALTTCVIIGACAGAVAGAVLSKIRYKKVNGWWVLGGAITGGLLGYIGGAYFGATGIKAGTLASKIKMSKVRSVGRVGEQMSGWKKNTIRIKSLTKSAKYRIPDYLNKSKKVIGEVKNVKKLSYTKQLQDFMLYAEKNGYTFVLKVRKNTQLSSKIKKLADQGKIWILYLK